MAKIVISDRLRKRFKDQLPALEAWCEEQEKSLPIERGFKKVGDKYVAADPSRHPKGGFVIPSAMYEGVKVAGLRTEESCCFLLMEEFTGNISVFLQKGHWRMGKA